MKHLTVFVLLCMFLFGFVTNLFPVVSADEELSVEDDQDLLIDLESLGEDGERDPSLDFLESQSVDLRGHFVVNGPEAMVAGDRSTYVVAVKNLHEEDSVHLEEVRAHVVQANNFRQFIQNFTHPLELEIEQGDAASYAFHFRPHQSLGNRQYGLQIIASVKEDDVVYNHLVFNTTVELLEARSPITFEVGMTYLLTIGLLVGLVFLFRTLNEGLNDARKSRRRQKKKQQTKTSASPEDEWLQGTSASKKRR